VHEYGEGNWSPIAKALNEAFNKTADNGRIGKQCREVRGACSLVPPIEGCVLTNPLAVQRWNHHLRPDIKKDAWTEEEEVLLVTAHKSVGNKWSDIARQLPGGSSSCNQQRHSREPAGSRCSSAAVTALSLHMQCSRIKRRRAPYNPVAVSPPVCPHFLPHALSLCTHPPPSPRSCPAPQAAQRTP
jgi:myb proto-oncogene protein